MWKLHILYTARVRDEWHAFVDSMANGNHCCTRAHAPVVMCENGGAFHFVRIVCDLDTQVRREVPPPVRAIVGEGVSACVCVCVAVSYAEHISCM